MVVRVLGVAARATVVDVVVLVVARVLDDDVLVVVDVVVDAAEEVSATELATAFVVESGVVHANQPVSNAMPAAPVAPVTRRARRAGCARRLLMDSIIGPEPQSGLGARWTSTSACQARNALSPPTAAVTVMNANRNRKVSLSVPAVTPWAVARMKSGKLR